MIVMIVMQRGAWLASAGGSWCSAVVMAFVYVVPPLCIEWSNDDDDRWHPRAIKSRAQLVVAFIW